MTKLSPRTAAMGASSLSWAQVDSPGRAVCFSRSLILATVSLLPRYREEIEVIQTHQFPLTSLHEAFACANDKKTGAIKVTVLPG